MEKEYVRLRYHLRETEVIEEGELEKVLEEVSFWADENLNEENICYTGIARQELQERYLDPSEFHEAPGICSERQEDTQQTKRQMEYLFEVIYKGYTGDFSEVSGYVQATEKVLQEEERPHRSTIILELSAIEFLDSMEYTASAEERD